MTEKDPLMKLSLQSSLPRFLGSGKVFLQQILHISVKDQVARSQQRRQMRIKLLKAGWKRWLIIAVCLSLIIMQQIWPHIQFNIFSISLLIVAAISFIFPDLYIILPHIRRIKFWEAELELQERAKELGKEVTAIQNEITNKPDGETIQASKLDEEAMQASRPDEEEYKLYLDYIQHESNEIRKLSYDNPSLALVFISEKIEIDVRWIMKHKYSLRDIVNIKSVVDIMLKANPLPNKFLSSIMEFMELKDMFLSLYNDKDVYSDKFLYRIRNLIFPVRITSRSDLLEEIIDSGERLLEIIGKEKLKLYYKTAH